MDEQPDSGPLRVAGRGLRKSFGGIEVLHGVDLEAVGGRVLALLGENGAGKSTAVKILAGDYRRDGGEILVNGEPVVIRSPRDASDLGIRVIYQEFSDAPDLTVSENLSLGNLPGNRLGLVDWAAMRRDAEAILDELDIKLDPKAVVGALRVAERQILEIARALAGDARMLILDEPTSALTIEETQTLFSFIRQLKAQGAAVIYITHRLDEVEEIADDVLVFRDGYVVAEGPRSSFTRHDMAEAMVGAKLDETVANLHADHAEPGQPMLELRGVTLEPFFENIDLTVRSGEIVSLFGRLGCGSMELAESVFGLKRLDSGDMTVAGVEGQVRSPTAAARRGVGFVPVDRKEEGLLTVLTVAENLSVASWSLLTRMGLLSPKASLKVYERWQDRLAIRGTRGARQVVSTLSGGNQQKVVLGRWLERDSKLLVMAEPTRGVDVGARAEIYRVLRGFADEGLAILVVSSDIEEVLRISDRIMVMSRGVVVAEHPAGGVDRAQLVREAAASHYEAAATGG